MKEDTYAQHIAFSIRIQKNVCIFKYRKYGKEYKRKLASHSDEDTTSSRTWHKLPSGLIEENMFARRIYLKETPHSYNIVI